MQDLTEKFLGDRAGEEHDKRATEKERESKREAAQAIKKERR